MADGEKIIVQGGVDTASLAAGVSWKGGRGTVAESHRSVQMKAGPEHFTPAQPQREGPAYIHKSLWPLVVPIADLKPDPSNARKHGDRNLESIVASLNRFGQRSPIVVQREGMVVRAGNGRLAAAKSMGWTSIAAVVVDEASVDATAFAIADNRTSDLAEWDEETLASLLQSLPDDAREAAGYNPDELQELLDELTPPEVVEDEAPEPLPDPVSRMGDVWLLDDHRLLCGDSTKAEDVGRVTDGRCDICATDPPYGVGLSYASHNDSDMSAYWTLMDGWQVAARPVTGLIVATVGNKHNTEWFRRYPPTTFCVWVDTMKQSPHAAAYLCKSELVLVWGKVPERWAWDTWQINSVRGDGVRDDHPCPKPVELWAAILKPTAYKRVYEPFSGSGTTIIACEQLGRKCYAIEIEPRYVDVAVRRWQNLTGKDATLEGTDKTWRQVAADRGVVID